MRTLPTKLLAFFREHEGEILSREHLAADVWHLKLDPRSRTVDQTISELRKGLSAGERIETLQGKGYKYK
ncbi:MAG TPA: helix-turn-helix domain-containing protein, partial [Methylomirabilota bacterium]|nr:helix-turn-helix domain-containing protein [Methylomirabilota bacterium]